LKELSLSVPVFQGNEWKYVEKCLDDGWISTSGTYIERFEREICEFVKARYAVGCINGTSALQVALRVAGVSPGDEVIVPTVTFIAAVNAAVYLNTEPVFMDADEFYNMDIVKTIEFIKKETLFRKGCSYSKQTGKRIAALIPVHVFGNAVNLEELVKICKERNIKVIEDATESLGTRYSIGRNKGKFTGLIGDIGCYSFNGNKIITAGGGGMIVTNNQKFAQKAAYLVSQAKDDAVRYIHKEVGYNYKMTNLHAAVGVAQFEKLQEHINIKKSNYDYYKANLDTIKGIHIAATPPYAENNHWMYALQIDAVKYGKNREEVMQMLSGNAIQSRPLWYLNHLQEPYKNSRKYRVENAGKLLENTLNIPCSVDIEKEDMDRVIRVLENG